MVTKLTLRPKLNGTKRKAKCLLLGHQLQNLIRDSCAVQRADLSLVQSAQIVIVLQIEVERDRRQYQPGKQQINTDPRHLQLDNRDICIWHRRALFDRSFGGQLFEDGDEIGEKVIDHDVLRANNQCINIGSCSL